MARILDGSINTFRALAYEVPVESVLESIRSLGARYDNTLTSRAMERFSDIRERHVGFDFRSAKQKVKAAMRKFDNYWVADMIQQLKDIGQFQHAPSKMIRYLMAEPETRERFYNDRCEGYGENYIDLYPNRIGDDDPVYRRVMEGIWVEDVEGDMSYTEYWPTEESDLEEELEFSEQLDVIHSWTRLKDFLSKGVEDPTSPYNGRL